MRVVNEYMDVFPHGFPGLPQERVLEFSMNLVLGTIIFKASYIMIPVELQELKA